MGDIFDVVSDATRRQLLQALLERYVSEESATGEISVGDLVTHLSLSQPTVSKQLRVLREHGLVSVREDGQHRYYKLETAPLEQLEDWLIPFLSADFDEHDVDEHDLVADGDPGVHHGAVFAAWSGVDVGETIGRRVAEGSYRARTAIEETRRRMRRRR